MLTRFRTGLAALIQRRRGEQELDDELRQFFQDAIEAKMATGMSRDAAERAARLELGSPAAVKDWVRDVGWETRLESVWQDVRYAGRILRRSPGFAFAAIATFALGIGANTAIFSIVDAAVLKPLPYDEPDRLVTFKLHNPSTGRKTDGFMARDFLDWRDRADLFENLAMVGGGAFTLLGAGEPEELRVARVSQGFFEMLHTPPLLGRLFTREDEFPGREQIVILSHAFWTTRFGASPAAVGATLHLDGKPYEIVGVLPERFIYPPNSARRTPVFLPYTFTDKDRQRGVIQNMGSGPIGRIRKGSSVQEVETALAQLLAAAATRRPSTRVISAPRSSRCWRTTSAPPGPGC